MPESVFEAVKRLVHAESRRRHCIEVCWFGGEPMLCTHALYSMSVTLQDICNQNQCGYDAKIVTNGYFLNKGNAERLRKAGVNRAQVTLDGAETHNKHRPLRSGKGTYALIKDNIIEASTVLDLVTVRINLLDQSYEECERMFQDLRPAIQRIRIDIHPVTKYRSCEVAQWSTGAGEYYSLSKRLYSAAVDMGFRVSALHCDAIKPFFCSAYSPNCIIVNPDGTLSGCIVQGSDPEKSIGRLLSDGSLQYDYQRCSCDWTWDPFTDTDCQNCTVLPLCMGGCLRYPQSDKCNTGRCEIKHNAANYLAIVNSQQSDWSREPVLGNEETQ